MKIVSKRDKVLKISLISAIFVCIIALVIITLTAYNVRINGSDTITFDKVAINANSSMQVNGEVTLIAGAEIVDGSVSFSKAPDSRSIYVRGTLRFSLKESGTPEQVEIMNKYIQDFNNAEFSVATDTQNGAIWVFDDGYYYLVDSTDNTRLKNIVDTYTYTLFSSVVMPTDLKQYTDDTSLLLPVSVELVIEAIQSEGVPQYVYSAKEAFNSTFGSK